MAIGRVGTLYSPRMAVWYQLLPPVVGECSRIFASQTILHNSKNQQYKPATLNSLTGLIDVVKKGTGRGMMTVLFLKCCKLGLWKCPVSDNSMYVGFAPADNRKLRSRIVEGGDMVL